MNASALVCGAPHPLRIGLRFYKFPDSPVVHVQGEIFNYLGHLFFRKSVEDQLTALPLSKQKKPTAGNGQIFHVIPLAAYKLIPKCLPAFQRIAKIHIPEPRENYCLPSADGFFSVNRRFFHFYLTKSNIFRAHKIFLYILLFF